MMWTVSTRKQFSNEAYSWCEKQCGDSRAFNESSLWETRVKDGIFRFIFHNQDLYTEFCLRFGHEITN